MALDDREKRTRKSNSFLNGGGNRKHTTWTQKLFACHPRRTLRIKSNCRFMLLALVTLCTLMLLFTVTEIENQNSPVIQDILYRDENVLKDTKKLPPEDQEPTLNKKYGDKKLRVDKKYLVSLGLPANPDDINIEVLSINAYILIHWERYIAKIEHLYTMFRIKPWTIYILGQ